VHFVGHSLGGLVVLNLLALGLAARVGRVILLGSPVLGCSAAEQLLPSRAGRLLLGRALLQWRRERAQQAVSRLEVGAIAGTGRMGIGSLLVRLSGQNDGVVTVEETRVPGLADHIVLPVSHSGMIVSARVAREVCHFLHHGRFARA
jgi:pimeloyl-ACP methyl ester carboxylesterase